MCDNEQMIESARKRLRKRAKRGFRGYPLRPSPSTAQTIAEPPSSLSALFRQRMPKLPSFDAGSPKRPISAMMRA